MKPIQRFTNRPSDFWANVKFISEQLGYSTRKKKGKPSLLRRYDYPEVAELFKSRGFDPRNIHHGDQFFDDVVSYLNKRAELLNQSSALFMDRKQAKKEFDLLYAAIKPTIPLVMNRQKKEKKHPNYLACMVAMIAEKVVGPDKFINDAQNLAFLEKAGRLIATFSRRFDGVFPSTHNPSAVWEIKEYYGTTTFGSRVSGGVYETLLDGFEIEGVKRLTDSRIKHFLFVDDRYTWWDCGKPYLCRLVDLLHTGHVDEIFLGREVLTEWEPALKALL